MCPLRSLVSLGWLSALEHAGVRQERLVTGNELGNPYCLSCATPLRFASLQSDGISRGRVKVWGVHPVTAQPFKKMLVRVKGEIIRMNCPTIRPTEGRAPAVTPATTLRWTPAHLPISGGPVTSSRTTCASEIDIKTQCIPGAAKLGSSAPGVRANLIDTHQVAP